jgi:hypothetical protein
LRDCAEVVLVADQGLAGVFGDQARVGVEDREKCFAFVGFGSGQREPDT